MVTQAHYLLVHPRREECKATGTCITLGCSRNWDGSVWADPRVSDSNEDPFVWSAPWLYSYCKATGLRRRPRKSDHMMKGSILIFADKDEAKRGSLVVDTVFMVDEVYKWERDEPPATLRAVLGSSYASVNRRHLRFGAGPTAQHRGEYTYSARAVDVFGGRGSFMPIDRFGQRVKIGFSELSTGLQGQIRSRLRSRLPPILLAESHLIELLDHLWRRTACAVSRVREVGLASDMTMDVPSVCGNRAKDIRPIRHCT